MKTSFLSKYSFKILSQVYQNMDTMFLAAADGTEK